MAKLHEVLAVENDLEKAAQVIEEETNKVFRNSTNYLTGFIKTLEMYDGSDASGASEQSELATNVIDRLTYQNKTIARYWDTVYRKDSGNQEAKADVVIDGQVIIEQAPATFLLGMETKLKKLRDQYAKIPTLDPSIRWEPDLTENADGNVYRAVNPKKAFKTAKTFMHKILVEPTEYHPAQVEKWEETVNVGVYTTEMRSGAITSARKAEIIDRIGKLLRAVKIARQRANDTEVESKKVGDKIFEYIMS